MNIFKYEMKQYRRPLLAWGVAYIVSTLMLMSATPLFIADSQAMRDTMNAFSDTMRAAMGIDLDTFFSPVGFYAYVFVYIGLAASIQAMSVGLGIISKETRMKTADFLMTKPASRASVYGQKCLAAGVTLLPGQAAFYLSATLCMLYLAPDGFAVKAFVLISLAFSLIQGVFMATGFLVAVLAKKIKSTLSVSMGVCFGTFILGMVGSVTQGEALRYLSPLRYFEGSYILQHQAYETKYVIIAAVWVAVCLLAGFAVYVKKDIHAA